MHDLKQIEADLASALNAMLNWRGPHRTDTQNRQMDVAAIKASDALGDVRFMRQ